MQFKCSSCQKMSDSDIDDIQWGTLLNCQHCSKETIVILHQSNQFYRDKVESFTELNKIFKRRTANALLRLGITNIAGVIELVKNTPDKKIPPIAGIGDVIYSEIKQVISEKFDIAHNPLLPPIIDDNDLVIISGENNKEIALLLATSAASETKFLGAIPVKPLKVLIISPDMSVQSVLTPLLKDNISFLRETVNLNNLDSLVQLIIDNGLSIDLIIFDNLENGLSGHDWFDDAVMLKAINSYKNACMALGCAGVLLHNQPIERGVKYLMSAANLSIVSYFENGENYVRFYGKPVTEKKIKIGDKSC